MFYLMRADDEPNRAKRADPHPYVQVMLNGNEHHSAYYHRNEQC
jgi:hypothetical protein